MLLRSLRSFRFLRSLSIRMFLGFLRFLRFLRSTLFTIRMLLRMFFGTFSTSLTIFFSNFSNFIIIFIFICRKIKSTRSLRIKITYISISSIIFISRITFCIFLMTFVQIISYNLFLLIITYTRISMCSISELNTFYPCFKGTFSLKRTVHRKIFSLIKVTKFSPYIIISFWNFIYSSKIFQIIFRNTSSF